MAKRIEEIRAIKKDLEDFHSGLRAQQDIDEKYYIDDFDTPLIQQPYHVVRSGRAAHLVDSPADHITTSNPQVFVEPRKFTDKARATAIKQARLYNHWLPQLKLSNPDPIKEFIKNLLRRGEGFSQILLNESWDKEQDDELPILMKVPDPMIVWASPVENKGIPECVVVKYKRLSWIVEKSWPEWKGSRWKVIEWWEYWDKESRYFEADGKPVFAEEIEPNIYGFVPFPHAYSGFGKSSPDGKPESLAVSLIKMCRSLLLEECQVRSLIDSIINIFAHPDIILESANEQAYAALEKFEYSLLPGVINAPPPGTRIIKDRGTSPSAELFRHLAEIEGRIDYFLPPVMQGMATSSRSSGRLEDILGRHAAYKYDTVIENTEKALSVFLDMGRQIMVNDSLDMLPITISATVIKEHEKVGEEERITASDLKDKHRIKVNLAAANPIESDRQTLLYRQLFTDRIIDWRTCLVDGLGKTNEEAEDIIAQCIADQYFAQDIEFAAMVMQRAREKMGMGQTPPTAPTGPVVGAPTQGGEPRTQNIQTPLGQEMIDMSLVQRGARRPPV